MLNQMKMLSVMRFLKNDLTPYIKLLKQITWHKSISTISDSEKSLELRYKKIVLLPIRNHDDAKDYFEEINSSYPFKIKHPGYRRYFTSGSSDDFILPPDVLGSKNIEEKIEFINLIAVDENSWIRNTKISGMGTTLENDILNNPMIYFAELNKLYETLNPVFLIYLLSGLRRSLNNDFIKADFTIIEFISNIIEKHASDDIHVESLRLLTILLDKSGISNTHIQNIQEITYSILNRTDLSNPGIPFQLLSTPYNSVPGIATKLIIYIQNKLNELYETIGILKKSDLMTNYSSLVILGQNLEPIFWNNHKKLDVLINSELTDDQLFYLLSGYYGFTSQFYRLSYKILIKKSLGLISRFEYEVRKRLVSYITQAFLLNLDQKSIKQVIKLNNSHDFRHIINFFNISKEYINNDHQLIPKVVNIFKIIKNKNSVLPDLIRIVYFVDITREEDQKILKEFFNKLALNCLPLIEEEYLLNQFKRVSQVIIADLMLALIKNSASFYYPNKPLVAKILTDLNSALNTKTKKNKIIKALQTIGYHEFNSI
jgi:hypothetical protein